MGKLQPQHIDTIANNQNFRISSQVTIVWNNLKRVNSRFSCDPWPLETQLWKIADRAPMRDFAGK